MKIVNLAPVINHQQVTKYTMTFEINNGEILPVMGFSGVGKTSLLNAIAGRLPFNGTCTIDTCFSVFQDSNQLFPWFTVRKNLNLACEQSWQDLTAAWQVDTLLDKFPNECSGGQKQRLTLIRALRSGKKVLLCDEPLSGVDTLTKQDILRDFKKTVKELNLVCVWVTHDPAEAATLSNKALLMKKENYEIVKYGNIDELYQKVMA